MNKSYEKNKFLKEKSMTILELYIIDIEEKNQLIDQEIENLNIQKKRNQDEIEKIKKVIKSSSSEELS